MERLKEELILIPKTKDNGDDTSNDTDSSLIIIDPDESASKMNSSQESGKMKNGSEYLSNIDTDSDSDPDFPAFTDTVYTKEREAGNILVENDILKKWRAPEKLSVTTTLDLENKNNSCDEVTGRLYEPTDVIILDNQSDEELKSDSSEIATMENCSSCHDNAYGFTKIRDCRNDTQIPSHGEDSSSHEKLLDNMQGNVEGKCNFADGLAGRQRKRRSPEEILKGKRQLDQKKVEREQEKKLREKTREEKRQQKERETQMKKAYALGRKAFQPKECLKHINVILDPALVSQPGLGVAIFTACDALGVTCLIQPQSLPYVVSFRRTVTEFDFKASQVQTVTRDVDEDEIIVYVSLTDFVAFVFDFKQKQKGIMTENERTLYDYFDRVRAHYPEMSVTFIIQGMETYFRQQQKAGNQQQYKDAVSVNGSQVNKLKQRKVNNIQTQVSRLDVEEALVHFQLQKLCNVYLMESISDVADLVKTFTKAVAEKPFKKDRLQSEFSFYNEKGMGVRLSKDDAGSLKMWKLQLQQFRNLSPDIASAIVACYQSPRRLIEAYKTCNTQKEAIRLLENIMVRRGTGILQTNRRVGKEISRRIYLLFTSSDSKLVLQ